MKLLWSAVRGEWSKCRGTAVLPLVVLAPYVVVLLFGLFAYFEGERFLGTGSARAWGWLAESVLTTWCLLLLPLVSALLSALLAGVDHRAQAFKHLFALPVSRPVLLWGKQLTAWLLLAAAFGLLVSGIVMAGWLLRWSRPELGFDAPVPWVRLSGFALGGALAAGFLSALQTWLALLRRDFVPPVVLGFLAVVSILVLNTLDPALLAYHPWAYPLEFSRAFLRQQTPIAWPLAGALGGLLFSWLSAFVFVRRDVL